MLLALFSSTAAGLTGFGDAVLYHVLYAVLEALLLVPADGLRAAVALIAVVALTQLPLLLRFAGGASLRRMLPYALALNLTAIPFSALGAWLLFRADLATLKTFVGLFFLAFASARLTGAALEAVRERRRTAAAAATMASAAAPVTTTAEAAAATAGAAAAQPAPAAPAAAACEPQSGASGDGGPTSATAAAEDVAGDGDLNVVAPRLPLAGAALAWLDANVAPISRLSPTPVSVRASLLALLAAGSLSGFLSGLMGVGGPPLMVAFTLLVVDKDDIRAISALFALLELPARISVLASQGGGGSGENSGADGGSGGFSAVNAPLAACTVAGAMLGFCSGTYARRFLDSASVLRVLLGIVLLASGILLGALENGAVAASFCAGVAAWAAALAALALRPDVADRLGVGLQSEGAASGDSAGARSKDAGAGEMATSPL